MVLKNNRCEDSLFLNKTCKRNIKTGTDKRNDQNNHRNRSP